MDAEKRVIASTSLQDVFIKQALEAETHETEKQDLERRKVEALERRVQLQQERQHVEPNDRLSFTKDELDQYVAHRKEGLAEKSLDWEIEPHMHCGIVPKEKSATRALELLQESKARAGF